MGFEHESPTSYDNDPYATSTSNKVNQIKCLLLCWIAFKSTPNVLFWWDGRDDAVIIGYKKGFLYHNVKICHKWLSHGSRSFQQLKEELYPSVWWDMQEIVHFEQLNNNQTIAAEIDGQKLQRLKTTSDKRFLKSFSANNNNNKNHKNNKRYFKQLCIKRF